MCINVYYNLGTNTEQFQTRQTHKSLSEWETQIYSIRSNHKDDLLRYQAYDAKKKGQLILVQKKQLFRSCS